MGNATAVNDETFETEVLQSKIPVLVDFWAEWCGPCKQIGPIVDDFAAEYAGKLKVVKVDVDESPDVAARYRIMSIPALIVFKDGQEADRIVGFMPKPALLGRIQKHFA